MTKEPYEVLLRWKDGKFSGGHIQYLIDGVPSGALALGTTDHPWPDMLALINKDALAGHADATVRCRVAEDAALEVPPLRKQLSEHQEALAALGSQAKEAIAKLQAEVETQKGFHNDTIKAANVTVEEMKAAHKEQVAALTEQLRIAKLPPAEQRAKELDAAMKAKEAELAAMKAEHAALLDPA